MFQDRTTMEDMDFAEPPVQRHQPRPLSKVLSELAVQSRGKPVSVRCIRNALADRSFATFLVLTCLINLLPFPPGSTLVLGIPIIIVALQMVAGRSTVWLPERFLNLALSEKSFAKMTTTIVPRLRKLENWLRPRVWPFASNKQAERIIGVFALILGLFVFLPVPGSNWFPAFAGVICGLALSERDGKWLVVGVVLGIISCSVVAAGLFFGSRLALGLFG
jgi:hypothetical protein